MASLAGKVAIVTGASRGIGRAIALRLSQEGASVVVNYARGAEQAKDVVSAIEAAGGKALAVQADVSKTAEIRDLFDRTQETYSQIDILVNNAGIGIYGKVIDQTIEDIEKVTSTNYLGMVYFTKTFLPSMIKKKRGHIVNVASLAASFGIPCMAAYCGSKFAILGFSESLSYELKNTNVGVTVVSPIAVKTNFFDNESFKGKMPHKLEYVLDPKTVSKAILKAACSKRIEIVVPFFMRSAVWLKHTFPYLINPIISSSFKDQNYN